MVGDPTADAVEAIARAADEMLEFFGPLASASAGEMIKRKQRVRAIQGRSFQALLSLLDARGFAVVPKEPVREMWVAGGDVVVGYKQRHHDKVVEDVWAAMLAAAPGPFSALAAQKESGHE